MGLRGLRERVESLGGKFKISSTGKSRGVQLLATLPLDD
jgi:signal transduction histidine kinase